MIDNANNATNFLYVLLLTHTQVANHCKIFGLLIKGVTETIENEAKRQKGGFIGMLLTTLGASLLGNLLAGKGAEATSRGATEASQRRGRGVIRASKSTTRAGEHFYC